MKTKREMQLELAKEEAAGIATLSGRRKLRVHVVGDVAIPEAAEIIGAAMVKHEAKRGMKAWTYTHAWRDIPVDKWQGARALASCHRVSEADQAMTQGYPVALTVPPLSSNKLYRINRDERGRFIKPIEAIPCPAQFYRPDGRRFSTCEACSVCQDTQRLRAARRVVAFQPDGKSAKRVIPLTKAQT